MDLAEELRAVRAAWLRATADGATACGLPVAASAYQRMQRAWAAELDAQAALLDGLGAAGAGPSSGSAVAGVADDGQ